MRLDLRRMPFSELAQLLRDIAREIEQRERQSNPQFRNDRGQGVGPGGPGGAGGGHSAHGGPMQRGGPHGKKRFSRPPFRGGPNSSPVPPPHDEDFNR